MVDANQCDIESYITPYVDWGGRPDPNAPSIYRSQCKTHQWTFQPGEQINDRQYCPIGLIEKEKDIALFEIKAAARYEANKISRIADIARRIRYAADMVGDDELPHQLHALARELEDILGELTDDRR